MKLSLFCACATLTLAAGTAHAADTGSPQSSTQSPSASANWAETRGTMTTEDVVAILGVAPTREQRDQIEQAVIERNRALREANMRFSAALQKTLAADDRELAKRVTNEKERQRLETMRRRQPGRYNGTKKSR
jgi:Spy/CpxP family protein refolding chaperone